MRRVERQELPELVRGEDERLGRMLAHVRVADAELGVRAVPALRIAVNELPEVLARREPVLALSCSVPWSNRNLSGSGVPRAVSSDRTRAGGQRAKRGSANASRDRRRVKPTDERAHGVMRARATSKAIDTPLRDPVRATPSGRTRDRARASDVSANVSRTSPFCAPSRAIFKRMAAQTLR